jgi:hypothetical protein
MTLTKLAGAPVATSAPVEADYGHTVPLGRSVELFGRRCRVVMLSQDEYLANYQFLRYGSFMGVTQILEEK